MTSRDFIKTGCISCKRPATAGLALQSCGASMPLFKATVKDQQLSVPFSAFTEGKTQLIVRMDQLENDILLLKNDGYQALYLQCTHEGVGLTPTPGK